MRVDKAFHDYFKDSLRQIFLYITDRCNLRCEHCLYKTTISNLEMDLDVIIGMLTYSKTMELKN